MLGSARHACAGLGPKSKRQGSGVTRAMPLRRAICLAHVGPGVPAGRLVHLPPLKLGIEIVCQKILYFTFIESSFYNLWKTYKRIMKYKNICYNRLMLAPLCLILGSWSGGGNQSCFPLIIWSRYSKTFDWRILRAKRITF